MSENTPTPSQLGCQKRGKILEARWGKLRKFVRDVFLRLPLRGVGPPCPPCPSPPSLVRREKLMKWWVHLGALLLLISLVYILSMFTHLWNNLYNFLLYLAFPSLEMLRCLVYGYYKLSHCVLVGRWN